ncbi:DUF898 family protein [Beijerinckia sp. L45]|uniref:DUF898 family protein n=1 Tax=Beijerinckia sp. L45 TaxID=1641855 RepID=UPI00131C2E22|nr:DUF898 family protein [Beijerinckia sp. L45]
MSVDSNAFEMDPPAVVIGPDAVAPRQSDRVVFGLDGIHFIALLLRAAVLELMTLGLYRFWLTNDIRRFLWSHTSLEGERLEYSGHGHELFAGFLGAFAILVALSACIYGPSQLLDAAWLRYATIPLFFFLRQVATYQARRYRLSRTLWRGTRFWMDGSALGFAARAVLWDAVVLLTLGLAWPWRVAALERYQLGHSGYGVLPGRFDGEGSGLFRRVAWMWIVMMIPVGCLAYLAMTTAATLDWSPDASNEDLLSAILGPRSHIVPLIAVLLSPFVALTLFALYNAESWRWWVNGIRFGDVEPHCALSRSAMFGLYLKAGVVFTFAALCVTVLGVTAGLVALTISKISILDTASMEAALGALNDNHPYAVLALLAGGYIVIVLTFGAVSRFFFDYALWRVVLPTLSFKHLAAAEDIDAKGTPANALGEGLLGLLRIGGL